MSLLEIADLVQHFPIAGSKSMVRAVNGVSFNLGEGETLALVGESGSGKTTIGRCVLGLIQPTGGRIVYRGQEMGQRRSVRSPELRGKLQLVFQEPAGIAQPAPAPVRADRGAAAGAQDRAAGSREESARRRASRWAWRKACSIDTRPRSAWGCSSASASHAP